MNYAKILLSLVFTLFALAVFGQQVTPPRPVLKPQSQQPPRQTERTPVDLQQADSLIGGTFNGQRIDKLIGNVIFKQKDGTLYADSVYQYKEKNMLEAFGSVRINQADTVNITGKRATYNGDTRTATIIGDVVMRDPRMTLTTPSLVYNLNTRTATYTEGGVIVDPENRLESRRGAYNTETKMFDFEQNVKVKTADYDIKAQKMRYNTLTKVVYFQGPTFIEGQQGDLYAEEGTYNTITKISNFGRNAYILTDEYRLGGDKLYYDQNTGYGFAERNVSLRALKDDVTIRGAIGRYWRDRGEAKVYGSPVMETIMEGDTLFLSADTLYSQEPRGERTASMIYAYKDVKIFKSDLQGKADSLSYNRTDSIMHLNVNPVLWSEESQMVADTIHIQLRNKTIDRMYMYSNAFISSEDSLQNYNQVKGRDMTAFFVGGDIRRVNVNGNGESLYFALEGDTVLTGMNKAICSDMTLMFAENKLKRISFLVQPDASFIPPHELGEDDKQLEGFTWMADIRPTKEQVLAKQPVPKAGAAPAPKPAVKAPPVEKTTKANGRKARLRKNRQ
ncbi:OstA-like protein [Pontibacter chinhatensis]|uniref:OstA-like protein n=1 Tax=Pontibacter chinhatensis TaxID=1436961 RepID=A0A1I2RQ12_9BACT|nr:OstA-like protein [Pontibacter chinhatensis]SFG42173.1 OstA-like protein [Pontibacter chinhatensis]